MIKDDVSLENFHHIWVAIVAYLEWITTRIWKLKVEIKDLLFVAFQLKLYLEPLQAFIV
jgi:hypothetical protein